MGPEDRIRSLLDASAKSMAGARPSPRPPERPMMQPGPTGYQVSDVAPEMQGPVRLPPMYAGGMTYVGDGDPTTSTPATHPEEWDRGVSFSPPSNRERISAAHQKSMANSRAQGQR